MRNTVHQMLKAAAYDGFTFKVQGLEGANEDPTYYDYEGRSSAKAWEACQLEGMGAHIFLTSPEGDEYWAMYIGCNDPDESLSDFSLKEDKPHNGWINEWWDATDGGQKDREYELVAKVVGWDKVEV